MEESQTLAGLKEFSGDVRWISKNFDQLREKYPNKYVAVKKGKVLGSGSDLQNLIRDLKKRRIDPSEIPIEFIPKEPVRLIL